MLDPLSQTEITYLEQFADSAADANLPPGFVKFHKENFCKYFRLSPDEFRGKSVLETGAGPGKHAVVLHLLGAHVTAVDLLESNIKAIERLKAEHSLAKLVAYQADLMQPLPEEWPAFDLISAHNWLQHAQDPSRVLENLVDKLRMGGRIYLSVYQAGTFRFFINQIARRVLRWNDRELVKRLIPFFFPTGFLEFENPDDIYFENILDDLFVPYMWTFRYESLVRFLNSLGCEILVPHIDHKRLYEHDNEPLKMGLIKTSEKKTGDRQRQLEYQIDEFNVSHIQEEGNRELVAETVKWAQRSIDLLQATGDQDAYVRAAFCLGLYRIRAMFSRSNGIEARHVTLQGYLERFVTGDNRSIRAYESSKRYYAQEAG